MDVLKPGGVIAFITPNKLFKANYGKTLRKYLADQMAIHDIIDFGELPVFKSAATTPMIFIAERRQGRTTETTLTEVKSLAAPYPDVEQLVYENGQRLPETAIQGENWILMSSSRADKFARMRKNGVPLGEYVGNKIYRGVLTGCNDAFVIDEQKRQQLLEADPNSADLIRPLAVGDDVRKWQIRDKKRYLIFSRRGTDIQRYPALLAHLEQYRDQLEPRPKNWNETGEWPGRKPGSYKWYEIQDEVAYYREFDKPKIIYPDIAKESRFHLDRNGTYFSNTTYFIPTEDLYLLGILNSALLWEYAKNHLAVMGDAEKGGRLRFFSQDFLRFPIPLADEKTKSRVSELVAMCAEKRGVDCSWEESEIEEIVNGIYFSNN